MAGPPSPLKLYPPLPAAVVMIPSGLTTADPAVTGVPDVEAAVRPDRDSAGVIEFAWVAGPPSPLKLYPPLPAAVVMIPSGLTRRIR